jgi:hypothetical protein
LYQIYCGLYSIYSIGRNFQVFFHFSGLDIYYVLQVQVTIFFMLTTWFIPKCTINFLMFWKPGISYKMCSQNAANVISVIQILKIFRGDALKPLYKSRAFGTRPSKISQSFRHCKWRYEAMYFIKKHHGQLS